MEKYIKGKRYKLGDYFVIDNKVIKVVSEGACRDCAFINSDKCRTASCIGIIFKHVANTPKEEKIENYSDNPENLSKSRLITKLLALGMIYTEAETFSEEQTIINKALNLFNKYIQEH